MSAPWVKHLRNTRQEQHGSESLLGVRNFGTIVLLEVLVRNGCHSSNDSNNDGKVQHQVTADTTATADSQSLIASSPTDRLAKFRAMSRNLTGSRVWKVSFKPKV